MRAMAEKRKIHEVGGEDSGGGEGSSSRPSSSSSSSSSPSSSSSSSSSGQTHKTTGGRTEGESVEAEIARLQEDYVRRANLAATGLLQVAMKEVQDIDIAAQDFGDTEIDLAAFTGLMRTSGPESCDPAHPSAPVRFVKRTLPVLSPESVLVMSKVTELFILDLALKSWHAKDVQTVVKSGTGDTLGSSSGGHTGMSGLSTSSKTLLDSSAAPYTSPHEISELDIRRAVQTHELYDMLAVAAETMATSVGRKTHSEAVSLSKRRRTQQVHPGPLGTADERRGHPLLKPVPQPPQSRASAVVKP